MPVPKKDILEIRDLATFERVINRDSKPYDIDMMVMPGTLQDKHRNLDPGKGIPALRRHFNLIYLLRSGLHDVQLGADRRWLKPNDLVIVPEGMVYASDKIHGCVGYCSHFKSEFLQPLLNGPIAVEFPFMDIEAEHIINVTDEEADLIDRSFQDIIREHGQFSHEKDHLLRNYFNILLLHIREIYRPHMHRLNANADRSTQLANRFKHLLEKNFVELREVQEYAALLNITAPHLSDVVKKTFGRTPRQMISDMLLLEAKVLLRSTDRTISEIAHALRFTDQAHFGHFIKQHTSLTPTELRANL